MSETPEGGAPATDVDEQEIEFLARGLLLGEGFQFYAIATPSPSAGRTLLDRLKEVEGLRLVRLRQRQIGSRIDEAIAGAFGEAKARPGRPVVVITDLAEDPEEVSRLFRRLNEHRNELIAISSGALLLMASQPMVDRLRVAAPDLWSVRAGDIELTAADRAPPSPHIELHGLRAGGGRFVGREAELARLDAAWAGSARMVLIVRMGAMGKSALVSKWLQGIARDRGRGARRVFAWSFHRQGVGDERAASSDAFLAGALAFFGDPHPGQGTAFEKADRLAGRVRAERSLLVLDGLEPLQYPPGIEEGRLKDRALLSLLRDLSQDNPGMVVITSRARLVELEGLDRVWSLDLAPLSVAEGIELLVQLGVTGTSDELSTAPRKSVPSSCCRALSGGVDLCEHLLE